MSKFKYLLILPLLGLFLSAFSLVPATKSDSRNREIPVIANEFKSKGIEFAGESVPVDNPMVRERLEEAVLKLKYQSSVSILALKRMQKWQSVLLEKLRKEGIPDDFIFLALAESLLDPKAVSSAGAKGLWQIMPQTGSDLGLVRNDYIDQRLDPLTSTHAAASYLKKGKERFGSWTSAAAAYNRGIPGLAKDFDTQKGDTYYELFLKRETSAYLYRILALKYLVLFPSFYGINAADVKSSFKADLRGEKVQAGTYFLPDLAREKGVSFGELMHFNPWLIHPQFKLKVENGDSYLLQIPRVSRRPDPNTVPSLFPLKGGKKEVTSHFGMARSPFAGKKERLHKGIDLKAKTGTLIIAPADGKVVKVKHDTGGYGIHVVLEHGQRYETLFAHLQSASVEVGQQVKKGEEIGKVGSTGLSTGPHLHYEIRDLGFPVDPADFMD